MRYRRMIMEVESPEQIGYEQVRYNLAESSMADRRLGDLNVDLDGLLLSYGDHRGEPGLRECIASDGGVDPDQVLVSVGAAGALFTVATALLDAGDRLVVAHPNYASNLETPYAIGAEVISLPLTLEGGFQVDLDHLRALITPNTKLVSLTTPHNPTGAVIPREDLREIISMVEEADAWLLLDETYRELSDEPAPPAVTLSDRVLSVSSLSKTYGVPGIRIGWVLCRHAQLMETLLAAKGGPAAGRSSARGPAPASGCRLDGQRALAGVDRAAGRRGLLPAHRRRFRRRPCPLLPDPERSLRHLGGARPLVRAEPTSLPARLRIPHHT
jgi:histidinol-phosphate/aromatic aminotransferase/cobyric acid decarboxylase-like protein